MAFLLRTRILQLATGTTDNPTFLNNPNVFRTLAVGQVVESVSAAMALLPAGQRPPIGEWWQYGLEWEVQSHVVPTLRGMATADPQGRTVVFDADFWETSADRTGGQPPVLRNTFAHQFTQKSRDGALAAVRESLDLYLIRAHFRNLPVDGRDFRISTSTDPSADPLGILTRLAGFDGNAINLPARWRGG